MKEKYTEKVKELEKRINDLENHLKNKSIKIDISDNVYWILFWFGIFILIFFGKC